MANEKRQTVPKVLYRLAELFDTGIVNWTLKIPEKFGTGYCIGFVFNEHIRLLILNYELKENIVIENPETNPSMRTILFKFQNVFETDAVATNLSITTPSVLIATSRLNTDDVIPIHTNPASINIEVDADYMRKQFELLDKSPVLQGLLENTQPLLFDQIIYPSLQKIIDEIVLEAIDDTFKPFFLRIKSEELVCRLLLELKNRDEQHLYPLNSHDVQTMYAIKERILKHLDVPPVIDDLAVHAGMSPTKLKRLFKQIFGNSIFSYYQEFRMKEAARLLKEKKLSVSDVGNQLGFSNLSHFSKVFFEHMGVKPKKYSKG